MTVHLNFSLFFLPESCLLIKPKGLNVYYSQFSTLLQDLFNFETSIEEKSKWKVLRTTDYAIFFI